MKYGKVKVGEMFFFEDNFAYPKVKLHYGHADVRDNVTGIMPDNIPVITVSEINALTARVRELEQAHGKMIAEIKTERITAPDVPAFIQFLTDAIGDDDKPESKYRSTAEK